VNYHMIFSISEFITFSKVINRKRTLMSSSFAMVVEKEGKKVRIEIGHRACFALLPKH
jgi:hypothetical protein